MHTTLTRKGEAATKPRPLFLADVPGGLPVEVYEQVSTGHFHIIQGDRWIDSEPDLDAAKRLAGWHACMEGRA